MEHDEIVKRNEELFAELNQYRTDSKEHRTVVAQIAANNLRLVPYVAQHYFPRLKGSTLTSDDLIAEGNLGLLNAIRVYEPEKGAFSSLAAKCIKNRILRLLKQEQHHRDCPLIDDAPIDNDYKKVLADKTVNVEDAIIEKDETERQLAWVKKNLDQLSPVQRRVLRHKYLAGEASLIGTDLAKKLRCTKQNISSEEKIAVVKLKKLLAGELRTKKIKQSLSALEFRPAASEKER